jgi:hypothetical protein
VKTFGSRSSALLFDVTRRDHFALWAEPVIAACLPGQQ